MAVYGIDLGTTYSCVARIDDVGRPAVLRNLEGADTTPSVVYFESADSVVVGQSAKDATVLDPDHVVQLVKRDMGEPVPREFHGRAYSPEEISARILRKLVDDAKAATGEEARDVVISVPAYFGLAERDATRKAGEIAGLRVLDVVAEPIAAALDYGALEDAAEHGDRAILVYDLGGGTFDTTVLTLRGRELTVLCTDGAKELGGSDFDDRVVAHLADRFRERFPDADDPLSDPQSETQLRKDAEEAKKALSFRERYTVRVMHQGRVEAVELTRGLVEELTRDLLDRTVDITRRTVELAAERGVSAFDEVLLVGGATKMPAVAATLRAQFGFEPRLHNPDLAVARGAALYALDRAERDRAEEGAGAEETGLTHRPYEISTVASRGYGIKVTDIDTGREYVTHLVHANDVLPASVTDDFHTIRDDQRKVRIEVMEQAGAVESDEPAHNTAVAEGTLKIPPGKPKRWPFQCVFTLDTSGLLNVVATERETGERIEISVRIGGLSQEAVDEARVAMSRQRIG
ncbi:Hsp70 family protein [Streptomyces mobaraensis NBRC 13819 = DSM 40847]|uniref:Heat shock protein 70 n=1 Tax=Streptomyces mobaraensis (strain ATCC 29032 / DSM 40847 / JCM 4168 / NBRC 13819 / NCIMB 11159 / IPCR 16-22) TaxID=1223523 RepID=M3C9R4_STRM1|nr:Hsp70 family protein [Streptomyces mobaraensis]EMF00787.1 Heat shock protein 70 [Streptomyces mobaraensis NBRC 13819 = DSM 40847]QTT76348.1 Hsp70 family protein [Streptomyces mobaraensis NBRC 13819 = DSM 40847]